MIYFGIFMFTLFPVVLFSAHLFKKNRSHIGSAGEMAAALAFWIMLSTSICGAVLIWRSL